MSPDRQRKVVEVFEAALELDGEQRGAFIERASGGDPSFRDEVWSLIFHDEKAGSFIEKPAVNFSTKAITDVQPELSEGSSLGPYRIIRLLGEGGMGVVYLARHTKLDRLVALKLLPEHFTQDRDKVRRFEQEARAASKLQHNNIITIYDIARTERAHYIVTEYVDGLTLREHMAGGPMSLGNVLDVIEQVASALKAAHEAGIVHRDVKPENIMIRRDGVVKVLDFGLAKLAEPGGSDSRAETLFHTRPGLLMGTPNYMSPEQVVGQAIDGRSDLFSLGAVLYECLTARQAFSGQNVATIWGQIQNLKPPLPSHHDARVQPEFDRITLKLLAKEPSERYQSADELIKDVIGVRTSLLSAEQLATRPLRRKYSTSRLKQLTTISGILRRPRWVNLALLCLLIISVAYLADWPKSYLRENKPDRWYEEGAKALRNGAYLQARVALERAVQDDNKHALAHIRLAEAYLELDNREKAREALYNFNKLVPARSNISQREQFYVQAVTAAEAKDFAGAIDNYLNIVRLAPDDPQAYLDLGRAFEKNNDISNAIANYEEARKHDPNYAPAFLRLGILYGRRSELSQSEHAFNQADEIYKAQGSVEGRAEVHYQHGVVFLNNKNTNGARKELERALQFAQAGGNEAQEVLVKLQLCSVYISEGDPKRAQEISQDAVEQAKRSGMQVIITRGLIDIGNAFYLKGDLVNGEAKYKEALESAVSLRDPRNEARARFSLGSIRIRQGRADEGLPDVMKARDFYLQGGYRNEAALCLSLIGQVKRDKGEYDEALLAFQEQLKIAQQLNLPSLIASVNDDIGQVRYHQGKYPEALESMNASYGTYQTLNDKLSMGYNLLNRGNVLWRLGRYGEAETLFDQARGIAGQEGGLSDLSIALDLFIAEMEISRGRFETARERLKRVAEGGESQEREVAVESKRLLGLIAAFSGAKRDEGVRLCNESLELATGMSNPWLISRSRLCLAQAMLARGDEGQALETALQAQRTYSQARQLESEWRALAVAARASERAADSTKRQEYATRAKDILSNLEQAWGTDVYNGYSARPDIASLIKMIGKLAAKA